MKMNQVNFNIWKREMMNAPIESENEDSDEEDDDDSNEVLVLIKKGFNRIRW